MTGQAYETPSYPQAEALLRKMLSSQSWARERPARVSTTDFETARDRGIDSVSRTCNTETVTEQRVEYALERPSADPSFVACIVDAMVEHG